MQWRNLVYLHKTWYHSFKWWSRVRNIESSLRAYMCIHSLHSHVVKQQLLYVYKKNFLIGLCESYSLVITIRVVFAFHFFKLFLHTSSCFWIALYAIPDLVKNLMPLCLCTCNQKKNWNWERCINVPVSDCLQHVLALYSDWFIGVCRTCIIQRGD